MSVTDSKGVEALIRQLGDLLCDSGALRCHAIYGRAWADAENAAHAWLQEDKRRAGESLRRSGCAMTGHYIAGRVEARFEWGRRKLAGFFAARRMIHQRIEELRPLREQCEPVAARCDRLRAKIERLERASEAPWEDAEFGPALRMIQATFDAIVADNQRLAEQCERTNGENGPTYSRTMLAAADRLTHRYREPAIAELLKEIAERWEQARIELSHATNKLAETMPLDAMEAGPQRQEVPETPDDEAALSPSRSKSRAVYDWALDTIENADRMTLKELHSAIRDRLEIEAAKAHGLQADQLAELRSSLPTNVDTFSRYLRDAGIKRYAARGNRALRLIKFKSRTEA